MRKSFDALSGLVRNELGRDPANGEVFVFVNRIRTCIKLLHWESGGFVLYYKRLEKGTFSMPRADEKSQRLRWPDLVLMIEGMEVKQLVEKSRYKQENQ
jgi:transposase